MYTFTVTFLWDNGVFIWLMLSQLSTRVRCRVDVLPCRRIRILRPVKFQRKVEKWQKIIIPANICNGRQWHVCSFDWHLTVLSWQFEVKLSRNKAMLPCRHMLLCTLHRIGQHLYALRTAHWTELSWMIQRFFAHYGAADVMSLKNVWKCNDVSIISLKVTLMKAIVWPVATYGCESWTWTLGKTKKSESMSLRWKVYDNYCVYLGNVTKQMNGFDIKQVWTGTV